MKVKNRAWVKNAAIIFLSVLLVLTFFSNTILNRSLPEVTGQNAYNGEISTAVRGKGTVTANEAYSVSVETSREITRVNARVGDIVEAGFVLFELEPADSTELEAAIKALEDLQYNYSHKILSLSKDYELENLQYDLEDALEQQVKSVAAAEALTAAKAINETAQEDLRVASEALEELEGRIAELTEEINAGVDEDLITGEMKEKKEKLEQAKARYESAKKVYEDAQSHGSLDVSPYVKAVAEASAAEGRALVTVALRMDTMYQSGYDPHAGADPDEDPAAVPLPAAGTVVRAYHDYHTEALKGATADAGLVNSLLVELLNHPDNAIYQEVIDWKAAVQAHRQAQINLDIATSYAQDLTGLKSSVDSAAYAVERAQAAWDDAISDIRIDGKIERETLRAQLKTMQSALTPISKAAKEAAEVLAKAEADATVKPEAAADAVKLAQRAIERKMDELESSEALKNLELGRDREAIADQQAVVDKLRNKEMGTEVTTRYGGTVLSIDVMVGDKTVPGNTLATIEINGKGYTLEFSVSNEEVQRVRIGDIATISSWGRNETVCTLVAIRTDRENPTRRKLLEFDVTGDNVVAGENLEISLGSRTQYYNFVVPNSAIREDADGKFVLIAAEKQTPLGTRYIATRVDITIVDQDTRNAAITGDFDWSPFVITTSSKPIEPNTQVRLA